MARQIIAGQHVFDAQCARKIALLGEHPLYDSEQLCRWQQHEARHGVVEAEIVKSIFGYYLRYASGLDGFGILESTRQRGGSLDGTWGAAARFAAEWQAKDGDRRFVSTTETIPAAAAA